MFFEQVKATFIAQANAMASQINQAATDEYNRAAQNWAANVQQGGKDIPPPIVPRAVKAFFDFTNDLSMTIAETNDSLPVIDIDSLRPKFATDKDAVGGPVGGPIPGFEDRFYQASNDHADIGTLWTAPNGVKYVKQAVSPFNRFWLRIG